MPNAVRALLIQAEMQSLPCLKQTNKKVHLLQQEYGTDLILMNGVIRSPSENPTRILKPVGNTLPWK